MPFIAIHGTFRVLSETPSGKATGFEPDGDSMQFRPNKPSHLDKLKKLKQPYRLSKVGSTQLRFEGIDALEIHFAAGKQAGTVHQPLNLALEARDRLVKLSGVGPLNYVPPQNIRVKPPAVHDGAKGWILSRSLEVHGRPVAFVFAGDCPHTDGSAVNVTRAMVAKSLNAKMLRNGEAYPLFYDTLFADLRAELADAVRKARSARRGLWKADRTAGLAVTGVKNLEDHGVIFPKLFRRLAEFYGSGGKSLANFKDWMAAKEEPVLDLDTANSTHFDTYIKVSGKTVRLTKDPARLVFMSAKGKASWL